MLIAFLVVMILITLFGIYYFKKNVDMIAAIIYGIYALLVILAWVLFVHLI